MNLDWAIHSSALGAFNMNTSQKDIAMWHEEQAQKHEGIARKHREMAALVAAETGFKINKTPRSTTKKENLTLAEMEADLALKGGRVNHVAARLGASEETIWDLLKDSNCKFEVGDRGFIYMKMPKN